MTMRVAFIVTSFWAYGELLIAKQFAKGLKDDGHDVMFIIPPTHKRNVSESGFAYTSLLPKSRKFNQIIFTELKEKFRPDLILLSDFLNYHFADIHYGILREDLDIFKCPIATFDNFNWNLKRKCMDTYGFVSDIPKKINLQEYGARILPCPILSPDSRKDGEFCFSLLGKALSATEQKKKELKEKHGFQSFGKKKMILVSQAKWQESCVEKQRVQNFIKLSNHVFEELIKELARHHVLLCIGEPNPQFEGNANIVMHSSMPSEEFDEFIQMADLYLGKNMTSTSMIKIAMSKIPCVNIVNSITAKEKISRELLRRSNFEEQVEDADLYKFMMYPVGWYYFLKPVFEDNPYGEIIECCEQFQLEETREKIEILLNRKEARETIEEKCELLKNKLRTLPKPTDIVQSIIC